MKSLILCVGLLMASCTSSKQVADRAAPRQFEYAPKAPTGPTAAVIDSLLNALAVPEKVVVKPTLISRAFGVKKAKCKGCTFYYGPARVTTVTAGKKAGPVTLADSGATVQVATNATAVRGNGNTVAQTANPAPPRPGFFAGIDHFFTGLAHWLLWLLLLLLILAVVFRRRLPVIGPFFN